MTNTVFFPGLGLEFELNRVAFTLFGHNIYWYGVIIAAGFLLAVAFGLWKCPEFGLDPDTITDAIFVVVPMAIVGTRAYYVIFNPSLYIREDGSFDWLAAVSFWDGGLAIYGGIIATVITALVFCRVRKVDFWSGMDITVYGLLIGQLIGRWGNFVNVEAYGGLTTLPWRMCSESIANDLWRKGLLESSQAYESILDGTLGVHPTFLYESLWNLLGLGILILLMRRGRRFNGQMFLSYVIWYGAGRAAIEGLRTDSLYFFGTGIRTSQMVGILSAAVGAGVYVLRRRTAGPATPPLRPAPASQAEPDGGEAAEPAPVREGAAEPASAREEEKASQPEETVKEENGNGGGTD